MNSSPEETKELISKSRPNLREVSVKQYEANLRKLKKLFESDNYNFIKDPSKVKDKINDLHYTTQRNMYNAIIVLLMAIDDDGKMKKLIETYSEMEAASVTEPVAPQTSDPFLDVDFA